MKLNIKYNSPVILSFALTAVSLFFLNRLLSGALNPILVLSPGFNSANPLDYISLFTYTLGHANITHLFGNLSLLLLIGPIVEEKYGAKKLIAMISITALFTAVLQIFFFHSGLQGASGIVFMLIVLASFTNSSKGIPLTFILVLTFYLGDELLNSFNNDGISQFAHIAGGLSGSLFGFTLKK